MIGYFKKNYNNLQPREKLLTSAMLVFMGASIVYFLLWQPVQNHLARAQTDYNKQIELSHWIKANEPLARLSSLKSKQPMHSNNQALLSVIGNSASVYQLILKRFEPQSESQVRVWLEDTDFNSMLQWISSLQKNDNTHVTQISIEKLQSAGLINANLTFIRQQ